MLLPYINMTQPQVYMCPHPETSCHLPPHLIPPGCHRTLALFLHDCPLFTKPGTKVKFVPSDLHFSMKAPILHKTNCMIFLNQFNFQMQPGTLKSSRRTFILPYRVQPFEVLYNKYQKVSGLYTTQIYGSHNYGKWAE